MDLKSINSSKILIQFKPLVYKTLQRLHIMPQHMNYDDYFQELQIKLLDIYQSFDGDPLNIDEDRYKFTAFAGRGLYWRGIDLFKQRSFNTLPILDDEHLTRQMDETSEEVDEAESNIFLEEYYSFAKKRLSDSEYELFKYLASQEFTVTQISKFMKVSRNSIYKKKKLIQGKIYDLKNELIF